MMDREFEEYQEERREFVAALGVDYRFGCYEAKRPDSCHLLGEYMEAIEKNYAGAYQMFKINCEKEKHPHSCRKYAMYMLTGKESYDAKAINAALECACDGNVSVSCRFLGLIRYNEAVAESAARVACEKLEKACELGDGFSCWTLSGWYLRLKNHDVPASKDNDKTNSVAKYENLISKDIEKGLRFATEACDLNIHQSCFNLGRMFKIGDGVEKNAVKAKEYKRKGTEIWEFRRRNKKL